MEFLNKLIGAENRSGLDRTIPAPHTLPRQSASVTGSEPEITGDAVAFISPLDDPQFWVRFPSFDAPAEINVAREQKAIDSICGVTRDNQPIMKLVWSGDRSYWMKFFMSWDALGRPDKPYVKRPLLRYGTVRNEDGEFKRDSFPPRWLILSRIEPEQYADSYAESCFVFDPSIGALKQIQPSDAPPVMWLFFMAIAKHTDYCCSTAERNNRRCFGTYAAPNHAHHTLGEQKRALEKSNFKSHNPYEKIDAETIREFSNANNHYLEEVAALEARRKIYLENPLSLFGVMPTLNGDLDGAKGEKIVNEFFDRQIEREAAKLERKLKGDLQCQTKT